MAMAVDSRQQLGGLAYDPLRYTSPQFTDPWVSAASATSQLYPTSAAQQQQQASIAATPSRPALVSHPTAISMPYQSGTLPAISMGTGMNTMDSAYGQNAMHAQATHDFASRPYASNYTSVPTPTAVTAAPYTTPLSTSQFTSDYSSRTPQYPYQERRSSHPSNDMYMADQMSAQKQRQSSLMGYDKLNSAISPVDRASFDAALDASRGMLAMSQDITPRNIYGGQGSTRSSIDSYGFPSTHSAHSSISSASTFPSYYNSSASEASYGDYGSATEDPSSRTLPRPNGLLAGHMPPAPQSMMGQFSSKVASSSQKKHKCKVCDKRFTRPSSLQTHMYSHTGEKPYACEVDGCGRHFSVVSNLRRHRKVHRGELDHTMDDEE